MGVAALSMTLCLATTSAPLAFRPQSPARAFLDAYLNGSTAVITTDLSAFISDLDRQADTWIQADAAHAAERRRVTVIAPLDIARMVNGKPRQELVEWACARQRRSEPEEFDRLWMLAAALILKGADHSGHAQPRHPQELRISLAGLLGKPEAVTVSNLPNVDLARLSSAEAQGYIGGVQRSIRVNDTIKSLESLATDPAVGSEATLRIGLVEYLAGRSANGLARFTSVAGSATDPYLVNLARMMEGLAHEAAGNQLGAIESYRAALEIRPTISAALILSTAMFLEGDRVGAVANLTRGDLSASRAINPWHDPVGDARFVLGLFAQMRARAGLPPGEAAVRLSSPSSSIVQATSDESSAMPAASPSAGLVGPPAQFRSSTNSVMVDVAVFDGKTPVTGLTPDDFELLDNGVPQVIAARGFGDVPLDVTVVLEFNDPVGRQSPDWPKRQGLSDTRRMAQSLSPSDRLRIIVASSAGPAEIAPLQPARAGIKWQDFKQAELVGYPSSSILDSTAIALLSPVPADRRALLFLFTDGIDGASILTPAKVLGIARVADAAVYSARRYTTGELWNQAHPKQPVPNAEMRRMLRPVSPTMIDEIVSAAGGRTLHLTERQPVADTFAQVLNDFRQRYVFFYTPTGVSETGWHKISVRLKKPGRYSISARRGYAF